MNHKIERLPRRGFKKIIIILLCIALVIAIFIGWFTNKYRLKSIIVEGCENSSEQMIKDKLKNDWMDDYSLLLRLKYRFKPLPSVPFVAKMEITMTDQHTIHVKVYEKVLTGCVAMKDSYLYFDKDGIVVESTKERVSKIPLVEGLRFNHIVLYDSLVIQDQQLFMTMLNLTQQIQKFELPVDKVSFDAFGAVTLYCGNQCEALLGKRDFYDIQLNALATMLKEKESVNLSFDLTEYDEGSTQVIAKPKK